MQLLREHTEQWTPDWNLVKNSVAQILVALELTQINKSTGKLCVIIFGGDDVAAPETGNPALALHGLAGLYDQKHAAVPLREG